MQPNELLDIAQLSLITLLWVAGPLMMIALGVGLVIAMFQALTSIQEVTLTFVPKILIVFGALLFLLPMMADRIYILTEELYSKIATG